MIRIHIVVPYEELYEQVRAYIGTLDTHGMTIELEHIVGTDARLVRMNDVDIAVARGITGRAIKRENPAIHAIEISISSSDLVTALWKCRRRHGPCRVGVVAADPSICDPEQLEDLTGFSIALKQAETEEEVYAAISELAGNGIEVFIGGLTLCNRCEVLGLDYVHIKTGDEAMRRAIHEAVAAACSLNRERARTKLIAAVLDTTEDAVFAVNRTGTVIASNAQSSLLFLGERETTLEGLAIESFFPRSSWKPIISEGTPSEQLETIGEQLTLVGYAPIVVDGENEGVLVTCRNVQAICETEQKIRKRLSQKGLTAHYSFGNILCRSQRIKELIAVAFKYSQVDSNVLIIGETGTGKELFAQSIHNASRRGGQPFVAVNCAALPEQLLESELFGYTEGSFSGAAKGGRMGLFELAHQGTVFLDEIGEMPMTLQAKILRVLQEREIRRVGGTTVIPVDVRILSATNIDILDRVRQGRFRQDLYYRINVLHIEIPPLRERPEDIELIFRHFIQAYARNAGKPVPGITPEVIDHMQRFFWRGNIRELRNFSERMAILNESGVITLKDAAACYHADDRMVPDSRLQEKAYGESLAEQLKKSGLDREHFADLLGISRTTLWRRLREEERAEK